MFHVQHKELCIQAQGVKASSPCTENVCCLKTNKPRRLMLRGDDGRSLLLNRGRSAVEGCSPWLTKRSLGPALVRNGCHSASGIPILRFSVANLTCHTQQPRTAHCVLVVGILNCLESHRIRHTIALFRTRSKTVLRYAGEFENSVSEGNN